MNARFGRSVRSLAPLAGGTRSLLEALEPRQLLASTFSGTDVDGDTYVVEVLGNGSAAVTTSGGGTSGFLETVALSGTDLNSTLRITVTQAGGGNGELLLRGLTVGNLGAMNAPKVNADNDAVWTFGQVKSIIANDMTDIDMAINGPAATKVALKFRTVDQLLLDSSQRVSTYAANLDFGAQLNFDEGVDKVTVTTDMAGDVVVTGPAKVSIGQVVVGGVLDGDLQVPNEIGSVLAGSTDGNFDIRGATFVKSITTTGDMSGQFRSTRFGPISVGGEFDGEFLGGTGDAQGVTFASIVVAGVFRGRIVPLGADPSGAVKKLVAGSMSGPAITCTGIDVLTVAGDATGLFIDVSVGDRPVSLGTVKIGGVVTGVVQVRGRVNTFAALRSDGLTIADPAFNAAIGQVRFTSTDQSIVQINAGTLTQLRCEGTLTGGLDLRREFGLTGLSMRTLRAARVSGFTVNPTTVGGLDALVANAVTGFTIRFAFINKIDIREVVGNPQQNGSMSGGSIFLNDVRPGSIFSIGSLKVAGDISSMTWDVDGAIGTVQAARMSSMTFSARSIDSLTLGRAPGVVVFTAATLLLDGVNAKGQSLGKATLKGSLQSATMAITGPVGSLAINRIFGTTLSFGSIGSLKVAPGNGFDGSAANGTVNLTQPDAGGFGAGNLNLTDVTNFSINSKGSIKSITAASLVNGSIIAGDLVSPFDVFFGMGVLSGPVRTIGAINITRAFDPLNAALDNYIVVTHAIGSLKINGFVDSSNGGLDFGFAAGAFGSITMRDGVGAVIKPTAATAPGTVRPLGGDFVIRSVV